MSWLERPRRALRGIVRASADLIFPPFCAFCGPLVPDGELPFLCDACERAITVFGPQRQCRVCAGPLPPLLAVRERCLACVRRRPAYERVSALGPYEGRLRQLITRMKYASAPALGRPLGMLLAEQQVRLARAEGARFDLVVPVPLDPARARTRGFNQAELVARQVADRLAVPCRAGPLRRRRGEAAQVSRSASARRRLAAGVFVANHLVWGRSVLLVDDVLTTGATVTAASRALRRGGARSVRVAVIARVGVARRGPAAIGR